MSALAACIKLGACSRSTVWEAVDRRLCATVWVSASAGTPGGRGGDAQEARDQRRTFVHLALGAAAKYAPQCEALNEANPAAAAGQPKARCAVTRVGGFAHPNATAHVAVLVVEAAHAGLPQLAPYSPSTAHRAFQRLPAVADPLPCSSSNPSLLLGAPLLV